MGEIIGYARVSSTGQDYEEPSRAPQGGWSGEGLCGEAVGSGRGAAELERCLEYLREGDTLIVTKLDRLARSTSHLHRIVEDLGKKGVGFKVLDDASLDTTTRTGKLVFGILASIAEFETALRKERQMEGIAKAKAEGRIGGRPKLVTPEVEAEIANLREGGMSIRKIAAEVGFSKATVQKILAQ